METKTKITTNHVPRDLVAWEHLPNAVQLADFPDISGDNMIVPRFVQYRGKWYDTGDSEGPARAIGLHDWDLYQSDSFFSGIVFRWPLADPPRIAADGDPVHDYERVIVGMYTAA